MRKSDGERENDRQGKEGMIDRGLRDGVSQGLRSALREGRNEAVKKGGTKGGWRREDGSEGSSEGVIK